MPDFRKFCNELSARTLICILKDLAGGDADDKGLHDAKETVLDALSDNYEIGEEQVVQMLKELNAELKTQGE